MKIRNYLKGDVARILATALFVVGGSASSALAVDPVLPSYNYEKAADDSLSPVNASRASVALYNALAALGATQISGTGIVSSGTTNEALIRAEVQAALRNASFVTTVLPAIKAAVAEFPGAPENIVAYVLGSNGLTYLTTDTTNSSTYHTKAADVVKAAIEGMNLVAPEFALGNPNNQTGSSVNYTVPSLDRVTRIVSTAASVVAARLNADVPTTAIQATITAKEGKIMLAVNGIVKQGYTTGAVALGVTGTAQWALVGDLAAAAAKAELPVPTAGVYAQKALIAAAAIKALPAALQVGSESTIINKVAAVGLAGASTADINNFSLITLKNVLPASVYNTAAATVALGDTTDAGRITYAKLMLVGGVGKAGVFRAAAQGYGQGVAAFINGVATSGTGGAQAGVTDVLVAQLAAGAASAVPADAATAISTAAGHVALKAKSDLTGNALRNTARINIAAAVVTELAATTGTAAEAYVRSAVAASLSGPAAVATTTTVANIDLIKLELAKSLTTASQTNASAIKGALGAVADTMSAASSVTRAQFAATMVNKVPANAAAIAEIARTVAGTTGYGGPISSGSAFMSAVFAVPNGATSMVSSLAAKMAFGAGLITVKSDEIAGISSAIGAAINTSKANMGSTQTVANGNVAAFAKTVLTAKDETGSVVITGSTQIASLVTSLVGYIDKDGTLGQVDRVAAASAFASAVSVAVPTASKDVVKTLVLNTNASGSTAWTDTARGAIVGTVVKNLKTDTTNIGNVVGSVAPSLTGSASSKSDFLVQLIKTAGITSAIQKSSEKVADSVVLASGTGALKTFVATVMTGAGSTAIDKVAAGAAVALKTSGASAQGVADLFKVPSGPTNFIPTSVIAAKHAQASVVAVPEAAVEIATTLSVQALWNNLKGTSVSMLVLDRSNIAGNSAGSYGSAVNLGVEGAAASAYPGIALGITAGVIDGLNTQPVMTGTNIKIITPADKAQVIAKVVAGIAPYKFAGVDQYDALVEYSMKPAATGTAGGAGFVDNKQRALLVSKAASVAGLLGADVFTNKVVTAMNTAGAFSSVTASGTNSISQFAVAALIGEAATGFSAPATADMIKAMFNGFGQNAAIVGNPGAFADAVLRQWPTTPASATTPTTGTTTSFTYVKPTAAAISGVAAGLALSAKVQGNEAAIVEIAQAISDASTATYTVPTKINKNTLAPMTVTSGTILVDANKPAVAAAMAKVSAKQAIGIVGAFAKNMVPTATNLKGESYLAVMANNVASVVASTAAMGGLVKNTYEEMAALGSSIILGVQSGSNAVSLADLPGLIGDITAQIVKVKAASAYDVAGAMLATAKAFGADLALTLEAIGAKFSTAIPTTAATALVNATKALNALTNKIDNFNVGAITTHETNVLNH